jgi:DNA-binding NarL/FixJ family response regulator
MRQLTMKKDKIRKHADDPIPVWIIDDNRNFCFMLSESMNRSTVVKCTNYYCSCKVALKQLQVAEHPPSVILLDIKMPVISGLDAIEPLKRLSPGSNILMVTSSDDDDQIKTALQRGANGYLLKSSSASDIIRAIENVQNGASPIDPHITKKMMDAYVGKKQETNLHGLTQKERQIVKLYSQGRSTEEIADTLFISAHTIHTHRRNIFYKMDINTLHQLVAKAYKDNLVEPSLEKSSSQKIP